MVRQVLNGIGSACEAMSVYGEDFVGGGLEMGSIGSSQEAFGVDRSASKR